MGDASWLALALRGLLQEQGESWVKCAVSWEPHGGGALALRRVDGQQDRVEVTSRVPAH